MVHFLIVCGKCLRKADAWPKFDNVTTLTEAEEFFRSKGWIIGQEAKDTLCPECSKILPA